MGLIKAIKDAAGGVLADQWLEYYYCDALNENIIMQKAQKKVSDRSSNTKASDNIISKNSIMAINEGQCMIIVEQGKVSEICAEPGEFKFDASTEPSIFAGNLGEGIIETFKNIGKRFTFGGEPPKDQRVYFFNTKELVGNKYGTPTPVPFRIVDKNIGLDLDSAIRCNGEYSYKVVDPVLFYTNVCGNVENSYDRTKIDSMLKTELLTALQPAFAKISELGIRYSALPAHTQELADALNEILSAKWTQSRGLAVASFGVNSVSISKEDEDRIKQLQTSAVMRDPTMAAASLVGAQSDALRTAAGNQAGAMTGFMGMGMAQQAGGMNPQALFAMGQQQAPQGQPVAPADTNAAPAPEATAPVAPIGWTCACGAINKGKFCSECGAPKPAGEPQYACDKCGWTPEDPKNPPKFCQECGDPFDDADKK